MVFRRLLGIVLTLIFLFPYSATDPLLWNWLAFFILLTTDICGLKVCGAYPAFLLWQWNSYVSNHELHRSHRHWPGTLYMKHSKKNGGWMLPNTTAKHKQKRCTFTDVRVQRWTNGLINTWCRESRQSKFNKGCPSSLYVNHINTIQLAMQPCSFSSSQSFTASICYLTPPSMGP